MGNNNEEQPSKKEKLMAESRSRMLEREKESTVVKKVVLSIIGVLVILVVILGLVGYRYVTSSLQPLNPSSEEKIQVEVPIGSTTKEIAKILEDKGIIKSAFVFSYYVKTNNAANFLAGYYELKPSMTLNQIIKDLQKGGSATAGEGANKILVQEGLTMEQIAQSVEKSTKYKKTEFLKLVQDEAFLNNMKQKYPQLLDSAMSATDVRYRLEGYLFPATYDYDKKMTLEEIVEDMIKKTDEVMKPFYGTIQAQGKTVQEVLTVASLVEKEGVSYDDRTKIANVFYNRVAADMPLQTDISVLYSLDTHKELVTEKDLEVDSPYNLYQNKGFGPGPFNNPGLESIKATLNPADTSYLYFLADTKTGKVYFAETYDEHLRLKAKYLD
ncbi:endolytic transglycosylase MltG [Carnobacterium divergens]|uniref:endolytic transglycosylase MltG n=1 Tax=Carnobacterium divergens TaxID=2748 RepID=UPI0039B075D9